MAAPELTALLDDRHLTGEVEVRVLLGPAQGALVLADDDFATALDAIEGLSQTWGGACHRLYAVQRGVSALPSVFYDDQRAAHVQSVGGCEALDPAVMEDEHRDLTLRESVGVGESLFAALIAAGDSKDWKVSASVVAPDDPWALAYAAVLGSLPDAEMNPHEMRAHGFRTGLRWLDIIDVEFDRVENPSPGDLVSRLRDLNRFSPARLSCALLNIPFVGRDSGIFMGDSPLPAPHARKYMVGPNLVVVYEPESISDLALIWNLRAAHGLPPGLPLAVPATDSILDDLRDLLAVHPQANFGIGGDRAPRLISTSVSQQTLEEIAAQTDPFVAGDWREFREIPLRPGRTRQELVHFAEGRARMSSWGSQDRIELGLRQPHSLSPNLKFTVSPITQPLPLNDALRPEWSHQDGWRDWGYQTDDRGPDDLVTVRWPSGWDVLEGLLNDRGLYAQPSTAGRIAASFLTRLGSFHQLGMLLNTQVLAQIYDLGTAKAMTWFRKRARDLALAAHRPGEDETAIQAIERTLSQLTLRPDDEEQPLATVETLRKLFANDRNAARAWIRWAEASDLLVRGARVKCSDCFAESWRQMGELAPPVTCRGCGKDDRPPIPRRRAEVLLPGQRAALACRRAGRPSPPACVALLLPTVAAKVQPAVCPVRRVPRH